jgi:hypothetical protein
MVRVSYSEGNLIHSQDVFLTTAHSDRIPGSLTHRDAHRIQGIQHYWWTENSRCRIKNPSKTEGDGPWRRRPQEFWEDFGRSRGIFPHCDLRFRVFKTQHSEEFGRSRGIFGRSRGIFGRIFRTRICDFAFLKRSIRRVRKIPKKIGGRGAAPPKWTAQCGFGPKTRERVFRDFGKISGTVSALGSAVSLLLKRSIRRVRSIPKTPFSPFSTDTSARLAQKPEKKPNRTPGEIKKENIYSFFL